MQAEDRKNISIELVDTLFGISRFLSKTGNRAITTFGLNQTQFAVLSEIVGKEKVSPKEITSEFLIEKANLSKTIKKLEQMSLISVTRSKRDMRVPVLKPTKKGRELFLDCKEKLNELKQLFAKPLDDSDLFEISTSINKLNDLIQQHIKTLNQ